MNVCKCACEALEEAGYPKGPRNGERPSFKCILMSI